MPKFSPGPWHLFTEEGEELPYIFEDGHFHMLDEEGNFVAAISGPPDDLYPSLGDASDDPELLASARLMAAAPAMLELLRRLVPLVRQAPGMYDAVLYGYVTSDLPRAAKEAHDLLQEIETGIRQEETDA